MPVQLNILQHYTNIISNHHQLKGLRRERRFVSENVSVV